MQPTTIVFVATMALVATLQPRVQAQVAPVSPEPTHRSAATAPDRVAELNRELEAALDGVLGMQAASQFLAGIEPSGEVLQQGHQVILSLELGMRALDEAAHQSARYHEALSAAVEAREEATRARHEERQACEQQELEAEQRAVRLRAQAETHYRHGDRAAASDLLNAYNQAELARAEAQQCARMLIGFLESEQSLLTMLAQEETRARDLREELAAMRDTAAADIRGMRRALAHAIESDIWSQALARARDRNSELEARAGQIRDNLRHTRALLAEFRVPAMQQIERLTLEDLQRPHGAQVPAH